MSRLLTLTECAERTGTTVRWWRRAIFEKRIPYCKLGALVRIDERDLEQFIGASRRESRDEQARAVRLARKAGTG